MRSDIYTPKNSNLTNKFTTYTYPWPTCGTTHLHMQHMIEEKLRRETKTKYKTLDKKLKKLAQTQTMTPQKPHTFYARVINNTNIPFTNSKTALLQKGLKYNIHSKKKNWIQNLALEAKTAITQLPANEREVYTKLVADRIDTQQQQNPTHRTHPEAKLIRSIQNKLKNNKAMITRTDKGNSIVILPTHQYETKIQNFILNNNFHTATTDPTNTFQTQIKQTIKESTTLIPKDCRWKYINMNLSTHSIKGLIKIHKPDRLVRPVVKWRNALACKLSRLFIEKIHRISPLPNAFNIKNTQDLIWNPSDTLLLLHYSLASLDITNLYSNIPVKETRAILTDILQHELVTPQTQQEILKWYDIITRQNYFAHNKDIVIQYNSLTMGAPSSGLIAEIFLQHIEHTHLAHMTHKHRVINYCLYVDDMLLIFDSNHTSIQRILDDFNALHPKIQFTAEAERDHTLNYLDISIHRTPTNVKTTTCRKPTFKDTIILHTFNHLTQHKYAAVRFLFNRLDSYNLQQEENQHELNIIHSILHNNAFLIKPHKPPTHNPIRPTAPRHNQAKVVQLHLCRQGYFLLYHPLQKDRIQNSIPHRKHYRKYTLPQKPHPDKFSLLGVYKLTCPDCNKAHVR